MSDAGVKDPSSLSSLKIHQNLPIPELKNSPIPEQNLTNFYPGNLHPRKLSQEILYKLGGGGAHF